MDDVMTPNSNADVPARPSFSYSAVTIAVFGILVVLVKLFARNGGWAEIDATKFHFAIIDYFIVSGFDWNYPQVAPMYPGMHVFFAIIARLLHLGPLVPTDWASFAIQSIWGISFVVAAVAITHRVHALTARVERPLLLLILLCSSYPIASWIWPTTELGAYAAMYGLIALSIGRTALTLPQALQFAGLAAIATLFRQNYAAFALAPVVTYGLACLFRRNDIRAGVLAVQTLPLVVVGVIVLAFTLKWGGLIAPQMAQVGMVSRFEFSQIENLIGLIGLVGFPFVVLAAQSIAGQRVLLAALGLVSLAGGFLLETVWPLVYDRSSGHWGSLIWAIVERQDGLHLGHLPIVLLLTLGLFVLLTLLYQCLADRFVDPVLVLLALMAASLLPQALVFQRYSEVTMLSTLAIVLLRRQPVAGYTRLFIYAWFGLYALVSFARPVLALTGLSG